MSSIDLAVDVTGRALGERGLRFEQVDLVTTHNPFAVNDLWFAGQTASPSSG